MKFLADANVVLDVLLDRQPHFAASAAIWTASESGSAQGVLAAHTVTTLHYLICRAHDAAKARQALGLLLRVFGIAPVTEEVIREAFGLRWPDFEDSVTAIAALRSGCDMIVTRDPKGFRGSLVSVMPPELAALHLTRKS